MTVDDYLKSVGQKCFINYYESFEDSSIDIKNELKKEKLTINSCNTKASCGRQIFEKGLEIEALKIIIESKKLDKIIIEKAKVLLEKKTEKIVYPNDIEDINLFEGAKKQISVNAYERNPKARQECIDKYGYKCRICEFDFEKTYGEIGKNFIHVHHIKPLSEINKTYKINPIQDLRPVCPNCHVILHKKNPPYSIEEIKNLITTS